jgi:4-methyl-5(b-hydroxyethyl)-thiazole monophosphate biosynthesis
MSHRVLVLLAPGFEEIEATCPVDLLRRADAEVLVASTEDNLWVTGRSHITLQADCLLSDVINESFDLLVLPGGPAVFALREKPRILDLIRRLHFDNIPVGAICAAPLLLLDAGILKNDIAHTAHGSTLEELPQLDTGKETIVSDNIITSRGAGTAVSFGLALVQQLYGLEKAKEIAASIHAA